MPFVRKPGAHSAFGQQGLKGLAPSQGVGGRSVGGVKIGSAGTGVYSGFKLAEGDDFESAPSRWNGRNLRGKYAHSALSFGFRGTNPATDNMMFVDPGYRGARSESPTDLGFDRVSVANSILTLTASTPDAGTEAYLPTTYTGGRGDGSNKPKMLSGSLKTAPHFMLSGQADFILEAKLRWPTGVARGFWPSFWMSTFFWPDDGEIDVAEGKKDSLGNVSSLMNVIASATDGGGAQFNVVGNQSYSGAMWINVLVKKSGGTVSFYDDSAAPGTLALIASTTTLVNRIRGAQDVRLDFGVATGWDTSTYNAADWPKSVDFDWWRAWVPAGAANLNQSLNLLSAINTTPGGSWAASLPSLASLYGGASGLEQVTAAWDNFDAPGMATRSSTTKLPSSMTADLSGRSLSGTVPTTEGGCMGVMLTFAYDDGSPAKRTLLPFNIAPAAQSTLFVDGLSINHNAALNLPIAYTDFHSGNLGPHTYSVSKTGGSWLTLGGNGTGTISLTGTAPASDDDVTLTIACTNSLGQTTTVTRSLSVRETATEEFNGNSGGIPANWAADWVTTNVSWVEGASGYMRGAPSVSGRHALRWAVPGTKADLEVLVKLRCDRLTGTESYDGIAVRGSGAAGAENGYRCVLFSNAGSPKIDLSSYVSGTLTSIQQPGFTWAVNTWYWMRVRIAGTSIKARVWADGASEPSTWLIDTTDSSVAGAGWTGIFSPTNPANQDFDHVGYAVNATAP